MTPISIHYNPVRAKICKNLSQYKWSSDHYYRKNSNGLVSIDKILNMFSDNRKIALEEYVCFMDGNELMISQNAYYEYEAVDMIGVLDGEDEPTLNLEYEDNTLDGILRRVVANEEDYQLIKTGSRQRCLKEYKISYVKAAVEHGYTFKEIGKNIGVSAEAVNKIVQGLKATHR